MEIIQKYEESILVFPQSTPHSHETIESFNRLCDDHQLKYKVLDIIVNREVHPGQTYLIIKDSDLEK